MNVDWQAQKATVLFNPRMPIAYQEQVKELEEAARKRYLESLWFATSGSTAKTDTPMKWVGLTREGFLHSAEAVNEHLASNACDVWINPLPLFHVGGQAICARSYLSGAKMVVIEHWDAFKFVEICRESKATLTALVPAQIYDLVIKHRMKSPDSLRAVVIGGGALPEAVYYAGRELGWPLLSSYGLTECSSQVATGELEHLVKNEPKLRLLKHITAKVSEEGRLCIKSLSLLRAYAACQNQDVIFHEPLEGGWFHTEDYALLVDGYLTIQGRGSDFVKIGGESVNVAFLEKTFEKIAIHAEVSFDWALLPVPDERLGAVIHLCYAEGSHEAADKIIEAFNRVVMPYEKIRNKHYVEKIPRTALKKVRKQKLLEII